MTIRSLQLLSALVVMFISPLGVVRAEEIQLLISKQDCRWLSVHVPADDVAYKPGVDVRGKAVAPADLSSSTRLQLQDQILLDLNIPLGFFLGRTAAGRLADADVNAGQVSLDTSTGQVSYNGQPLSDQGRRGLAAACRAMDKAKR